MSTLEALPPDVVERVDHDDLQALLASHRAQIAVVFFDLRGFTAFSERSEPEDVMRVLSEFHQAIGTQSQAFAGTIERFVDHVQTVRLATLCNPPTRKIVVDGLEGLHEVLVQRSAARTRARMAAFLAAAEKAFFSVRAAELHLPGAVA